MMAAKDDNRQVEIVDSTFSEIGAAGDSGLSQRFVTCLLQLLYVVGSNRQFLHANQDVNNWFGCHPLYCSAAKMFSCQDEGSKRAQAT